jgi:ferredoxin
VFVAGLLGRRFWCRYLCPTGALLSLAGLLRLTKRKVETRCTACRRCVEACAFDAIKADFATRGLDCMFCQVCGAVCPVGAIQFTGRWERADEKPRAQPTDEQRTKSRRRFLLTVAGVCGGALAGGAVAAAMRSRTGAPPEGRGPIRPPGGLPEPQFTATCIRCGACLKACPTRVLQPMGFEQGLGGLWTPAAEFGEAYCHRQCNNCGQVCPTGAIGPLSLAAKQRTPMGRAVVNERTCILCLACVDACPYAAVQSPMEAGEFDLGHVLVDPARCVGCGVCQYTCHTRNVRLSGQLRESAIVVRAVI